MASALSMGGQPLHLLGICWAHDLQLDGDIFEVGRRVIDAIFLSVAKGGAYIGGRVIDRDLI